PNPWPGTCVEPCGGIPEKRSAMSAKCGWCMPTLAAGALALAAVGCGGSSYSGSSSKKPARTAAPQTPAPAAAGQKLKLSADQDGGLYFEPKKLAAKTGVVTL